MLDLIKTLAELFTSQSGIKAGSCMKAVCKTSEFSTDNFFNVQKTENFSGVVVWSVTITTITFQQNSYSNMSVYEAFMWHCLISKSTYYIYLLYI